MSSNTSEEGQQSNVASLNGDAPSAGVVMPAEEDPPRRICGDNREDEGHLGTQSVSSRIDSLTVATGQRDGHALESEESSNNKPAGGETLVREASDGEQLLAGATPSISSRSLLASQKKFRIRDWAFEISSSIASILGLIGAKLMGFDWFIPTAPHMILTASSHRGRTSGLRRESTSLSPSGHHP